MKKYDVQFVYAEYSDVEEPEAYYTTVEAENHQEAAKLVQARNEPIEVIAVYEVK